MPHASHPNPTHEAPRPPLRSAWRAWRGWRLGTPLVGLACGALFVVSAANSDGTDLRPGRYTDLATLVKSESERYQSLEQQVSELNRQVASLTGSVDDDAVKRYQRRIDELSDPAGMEPQTGAGVEITLADAPEDLVATTKHDPNLLVVHQQDVQAVVNALWRGGARAVTIQGQRVISTTGIKCEGNAVQLQGVPYPQPFVIRAVGDLDDLVSAIDGDDYLELYREQAEDPTIDIGWELESESHIEAPAYEGLLDLSYARALD